MQPDSPSAAAEAEPRAPAGKTHPAPPSARPDAAALAEAPRPPRWLLWGAAVLAVVAVLLVSLVLPGARAPAGRIFPGQVQEPSAEPALAQPPR